MARQHQNIAGYCIARVFDMYDVSSYVALRMVGAINPSTRELATRSPAPLLVFSSNGNLLTQSRRGNDKSTTLCAIVIVLFAGGKVSSCTTYHCGILSTYCMAGEARELAELTTESPIPHTLMSQSEICDEEKTTPKHHLGLLSRWTPKSRPPACRGVLA